MKVKLSQDVLQANEAIAEVNAARLREAGVFAVDMMSSPGSGKTTILERTIDDLSDRLEIAVIVGDVSTTRDAERIEEAGADAVQINTGGACHLDANMIRDVLDDMELAGYDVLFIENIGNLVCPAGYVLGEAERVMVLSTPEGTDKPAKYPAMFRTCSVALLNKIDLSEALGVDDQEFVEEIGMVNPHMKVMSVSALTGEGMEEWYDWLQDGVNSMRK